MKKESKKRIDLYDIGDGLTLMNLIEKNDSGKMHHITTYILDSRINMTRLVPQFRVLHISQPV